MKKVTIYTDGACSGNPGPGGWAAVLRYGDAERVLTGAEKHTTNNRMELQAAIGALQVLREPCRVDLHTDSAYLSRAFTDGWIENWIKRDWKTASKKPVENRDLWEQLLLLTRRHKVTWIKVKGHADDDTNNRVDRLAVEAMRLGP
jgi:ribonuclease HI